MPRVLFTISYEIKADMRDRYLELVDNLKHRVRNEGGKNYTVYETKGKKNHFTEVFISETLEEYESLEDNQDEATQELVRQLEQCVTKSGMRYSTLIEVE
jgi:quinol monooxygenase YgiN